MQQLLGGGGGWELVGGHLSLEPGQEVFDAWVAVEAVVEFLFDHGMHPLDGLMLAAGGKGTGVTRGADEFVDGLP